MLLFVNGTMIFYYRFGEFDGAMTTRIIAENMELPLYKHDMINLKTFTCNSACFSLFNNGTLVSWANPDKGMLGWGSEFYNDPTTFIFTLNISSFGTFQTISMQRDTGMILADGKLYGFGRFVLFSHYCNFIFYNLFI